MIWLTAKLMGYVACALLVALLGLGIAYKVQGNRLQAVTVSLKAERTQTTALARQLSQASSANAQWQAAVLQLSADAAGVQAERDKLARANRAAVKRVREAEQLYVKPGAPSTTCASALKQLDKACPELKGY